MIFQVDLGLNTFLQTLTGLPNQDILYASNAFSFRKRLEQVGEVRFPFLNFRIQPNYPKFPDTTTHKNYHIMHNGYYDTDLEGKVKLYPFTARYDCTFWFHNFVNAMQVYQNLYIYNRDDLVFNYEYIVRINDTNYTVTLSEPFEFVDLSFDPQWTAQEELDKNKIHSIDMSFEITAFILEGKDVLPPNEIIVESFYNNEDIEQLYDDGEDTDNYVDRRVTIVPGNV